MKILKKLKNKWEQGRKWKCKDNWKVLISRRGLNCNNRKCLEGRLRKWRLLGNKKELKGLRKKRLQGLFKWKIDELFNYRSKEIELFKGRIRT